MIDFSLDETVRIDELTGGSHMDLTDCRSLCSASGVAPSGALELQSPQRQVRSAEFEFQARARQQELSELRQLVSILTVQSRGWICATDVKGTHMYSILHILLYSSDYANYIQY